MRKGRDCNYNKQIISVVICDTDITSWLTSYDFNLIAMNLGLVGSLLAETLYQGNPDRNHKLWNTIATKIYILHT